MVKKNYYSLFSSEIVASYYGTLSSKCVHRFFLVWFSMDNRWVIGNLKKKLHGVI